VEFEELVGGIEFMSPDGLFNNNKLTISQNEMLKSIHENPFTIVYKRRQEGVSMAISVYMMWLLVNNPGYSIGFLFSSSAEREIFRQMINMNLSKLEEMFKKQGIDMMLTPEKHNQKNTMLPNGSTIHYWSKKSRDSWRGRSVDFIYISELGLQDNFIELMACLFPLVALNQYGRFLITTTDLRHLKDDFEMNGDGIYEHWCDSFFDGRRFVIFEKCKPNPFF
jgi:hypothetical protein